MSIVLTHIAGPLAGQSKSFADDQAKILIGRDASKCDFVFPPDMTIVGREHCVLTRRISGDYELELLGQHFVEMNGEPVNADKPLPLDTVLTLGRHDGPRFRVHIEHAVLAADLALTTHQQAPPSVWAIARRTRVLVLASIALIICVGVGLVWQMRDLQIDEASSVAMMSQIVSLAEQQKSEAAGQISLKLRQHLSEAVYAVVLRDAKGRERLLGTSWAAASHVLATNAHVAAEFSTLKPGEEMVVRPSGDSPTASIVTSVSIHPGYKAFDHFVNEDALVVKSFGGWDQVQTIGGYDVALLNVADTLPAKAILQIATNDELAALKPGAPLVFAGFPYENIQGSSVQPIGRTPQVQLGNVTALTNYFLLPAPFDQRLLLQHNLPATGGASGSPIMSANGHVIGLLSAINITSLPNERIPSAALINYGQRVDVLASLLDGTADAAIQSALPYWKRETSAFERAGDVVIASVLEDAKPKPDATFKTPAERDFSVSKANRFVTKDKQDKPTTVRAKIVPIMADAGQPHFVVAYGKNLSRIIGISVLQNGKIIASGESHGSWAGVNYTAADGGDLSVLVLTADSDIDVVVRNYTWNTSAT